MDTDQHGSSQVQRRVAEPSHITNGTRISRISRIHRTGDLGGVDCGFQPQPPWHRSVAPNAAFVLPARPHGLSRLRRVSSACRSLAYSPFLHRTEWGPDNSSGTNTQSPPDCRGRSGVPEARISVMGDRLGSAALHDRSPEPSLIGPWPMRLTGRLASMRSMWSMLVGSPALKNPCNPCPDCDVRRLRCLGVFVFCRLRRCDSAMKSVFIRVHPRPICDVRCLCAS